MALAIEGLDTLYVNGDDVATTGGTEEVVNPVTEEVVGMAPVAGEGEVDTAIIGFDTDDEALAITNDSRFGLRAGTISTNAGLAYEMAAQLRTGHVLINGGALTSLSSVPLGGIKRSGYGREGGDEGDHAYTEPKAIEFHAG